MKRYPKIGNSKEHLAIMVDRTLERCKALVIHVSESLKIPVDEAKKLVSVHWTPIG